MDPAGIVGLVASRLIALDKNPGVCPIGVGEVVRRIISRTILSVVKLDILEAAGYSQLCAGQDAGNEAAVHGIAMRAIYDNPSTEAVLLADASNAFNNLNHQIALRNIQTLCPSLSTVLINTYREDVPLFIDNHCILSLLYRRFEREKQRKYEQRIREMEMGCFTPLVFSTFGGMSTICNIFFKRLASLLADKRDVSYDVVMSWHRCRVSFSPLRSAYEGPSHLRVMLLLVFKPLIWLYQRDGCP